jgi:imidazole glycerol phosphate synthase glutamine amidotransferase subunit
MPVKEVIVVPTGTANMASILGGLRRAGASVRVSEDKAEVKNAGRLVLPGVGTMAAAMERLGTSGLVEPLRERIAAGRPIMAVCLGLQLLCAQSEESPGLSGLGVIDETVTRFPQGLRVPQLGWNSIVPDGDSKLLRAGYAYFANSYCLRRPPSGWTAAMADYGGPFVAAIERGTQLGCQFHPELSSEFGIDLIRRWLDASQCAGEKPC